MQTSPWKAILVLFQRCTILGTAQWSVKVEAVREVGLPPFGVCGGAGGHLCVGEETGQLRSTEESGSDLRGSV